MEQWKYWRAFTWGQDNSVTFTSHQPAKKISKSFVSSKLFALLMEKGNANSILKLLTSNFSNHILPLDDKTLSLQNQKHSTSSKLNKEVLLTGEKTSASNWRYWRELDKRSIIKDHGWFWSLRTRWRWMEKDSCVQELWNNYCWFNTTRRVFGFRLIPLDKNPWLQPIKVGEALQQIAGK